MKMTNQQYAQLVKELAPKSKLLPNALKAYAIGGMICVVGQLVGEGCTLWLTDGDAAKTATSVIMVFFGAMLTGLGVYDKLARHAGAGTLVPITGFANSVAAPAVDFKSEGWITGTAVKMFTIAGPVLVYGLAASVLYGLILLLIP